MRDARMLNDSQMMNKTLSGQRVGFVGLGNMGRAMARHLHQAGAEVIVWNRSPGPAESAVAMGMRRAASLPELARTIGPGIICVNLTTTQVVREVVFGVEGLAVGLNSQAMIIDFGTTGVPETQDFAGRIPWLDAPVSGGQVGAEAGDLSIMVGGSESAFQRALPILQTVGKRITHMGPVGAGQDTKLANQLIIAQTIYSESQAQRLS